MPPRAARAALHLPAPRRSPLDNDSDSTSNHDNEIVNVDDEAECNADDAIHDAHVHQSATSRHLPPPITLTHEDAAMLDRYDEQMLKLLEQELHDVQTLKRETESQVELLLEEQKKLEAIARREERAQETPQGNRLSRIEQLQAQERVRLAQLAATREREANERVAREAEVRRKQENSIETRNHDDDDDLDAFLAHESAYY